MTSGGETVFPATRITRKWWVHEDDTGINVHLTDPASISLRDRCGGEQLAKDLCPSWVQFIEMDSLSLLRPRREHADPCTRFQNHVIPTDLGKLRDQPSQSRGRREMLHRDLLFAPHGLGRQAMREEFQRFENFRMDLGSMVLPQGKQGCDLKSNEAVTLRPGTVAVAGFERHLHCRIQLGSSEPLPRLNLGEDKIGGCE